MNRNISDELVELVEVFKVVSKSDGLKIFSEIFTEPELETISKRLKILKMLSGNKTQREIAKELQVSLCKVTRGAKILKDSKSIIAKHIKKEKKQNEI